MPSSGLATSCQQSSSQRTKVNPGASQCHLRRHRHVIFDLNIYGTPDWSPNGKKIAFVGEEGNGTCQRL